MLAVELHAEALVSSDRAFGRVRDLTHVVPDERGLAALLGR
jgi:hypothetical protein